MKLDKNGKIIPGHVHYAKWGYIFLIPFMVAFLLFSFIPLFQTLHYSWYTYYEDQLDTVGPTWAGFSNYVYLFQQSTPRTFYFFGIRLGTMTISDLGYYTLNTMLIWVMGFIPQIIVSLLLAVLFTDVRLKLRFQGFFKTVYYMPNLIMAAAFGMLFQMIFARSGPVSSVLLSWGWISEPLEVSSSTWQTRLIISFLDFVMWFGNTTLLLMAGVMGIDQSIFESATLDGASSITVFRKITMPLLKPIFVYVFITSMIGGIQLFDVAQIFTSTSGGPQSSAYTLMMYLYSLIADKKNYGQAGALSMLMFLVTAVLSFTVYKTMHPKYNAEKDTIKCRKRRWKEYAGCPDTIAEMALARPTGPISHEEEGR